MLSGASVHSGRSLHLGHSLSPALVATTTFHWGGRAVSCSAQGWDRAVGGSPGHCRSPERVPDPAWEMGEGRGGVLRPGGGGGRAGEPLRVDVRCSGPGVYQPAGERGPACLGTCGFGLAGSCWASRERRELRRALVGQAEWWFGLYPGPWTPNLCLLGRTPGAVWGRLSPRPCATPHRRWSHLAWRLDPSLPRPASCHPAWSARPCSGVSHTAPRGPPANTFSQLLTHSARLSTRVHSLPGTPVFCALAQGCGSPLLGRPRGGAGQAGSTDNYRKSHR